MLRHLRTTGIDQMVASRHFKNFWWVKSKFSKEPKANRKPRTGSKFLTKQRGSLAEIIWKASPSEAESHFKKVLYRNDKILSDKQKVEPPSTPSTWFSSYNTIYSGPWEMGVRDALFNFALYILQKCRLIYCKSKKVFTRSGTTFLSICPLLYRSACSTYWT